MVALPETQLPGMTPEEFLEWEQTQELRYEYVDGQVISMQGELDANAEKTIAHNDLALSLYRLLYDRVKSRGGRINVADVKVKVRRRFRYPDLVVTCDERDKTAIKQFQYPKVIVEVLSPGTESVDRGKKLQEYQSLETLQEYVLINSQEMAVEIYRRGEGRTWLYESYGDGEEFALASLEFDCAIAHLYEGITLPEIEEPDEADEPEL
ncbi:Uma2 family endonuclease [filamentous cyanobacterium LEGE 11480]|uniref:Uma2 family endonuclease n=1 Tax=Romeriopsis navalis LEGE 11480 TaxID=2777977 RepID=A0A928VQV5_9CYAN|nr:Uma2 family endonuclease [Romeriopsis navalis]MBE9033006.1 Uma2 family endonuclease [Romeriopsis navalis LEGE 11480]